MSTAPGVTVINDPNKVDCLDHGYVRYIASMGTDIDVVRAARTSHDAAWRSGEDEGKDKKLIEYLMKNGHSTPFEMVSFKFEVKAPIFVYRQWHRHRTQSYNEMSARYTKLPEEWWTPRIEDLAPQDTKNKQARAKLSSQNDKEWHDRSKLRALMHRQNTSAYELYEHLLSKGVAREVARSVLPVSMYSKMFATANMLNWFRFLNERLHPHAQPEIRVYAEAIAKFIKQQCPVSYDAFETYMRKA